MLQSGQFQDELEFKLERSDSESEFWTSCNCSFVAYREGEDGGDVMRESV